ncbi:hypothetical protein [Mucilaginibacter endophyticus]|nr:hypothetical protein [Mucilaginibacter endophyticus]
MKKQHELRLPGLDTPVNAPASELEVVSPNLTLIIASVAIVVIINS